MASAIRTVGVIATGVIGASWASLFLARGLKVIVTDPAPGAKERFEQFVEDAWPALVKIGVYPGASHQNYEFVDDVWPRLAEVDFVQEVNQFCSRHGCSVADDELLECAGEG